MTIHEILLLLKKRILLIVLLTLIFGAGTFAYARTMLIDYYQAYSVLIVSNSDSTTQVNSLTSSEYNLNIQLVNSYQVLCKTDRVLSQVVQELNLPYSANTLRSMVSVGSQSDTEIIRIGVTNADPQAAQLIANTLSKVFQKEVTEIMKMDNVQIIDEAQLPTAPSGPDRTKYTLMGILLGLAAGIGLSFLLEYIDQTVRTKEQLQEILALPTLGVIPRIDGRKPEKKAQRKKSSKGHQARISNYIKDSFSKLKVNIDFSCLDCDSRCIAVTSALPCEGKTLVATNLAVSMAASGYKTLLLDADMRSPSIHSTLNLVNASGLSDAILLKTDWRKLVLPTTVPRLSVITAGQKPPNPARILESKLFLEMINEIKGDYEYVVIDTPPLLPVSDSQIIAPHADGVVLVISQGKTKIESIKQAKDILVLANANLIGTVLNGVREKSNQYGYEYK